MILSLLLQIDPNNVTTDDLLTELVDTLDLIFPWWQVAIMTAIVITFALGVLSIIVNRLMSR